MGTDRNIFSKDNSAIRTNPTREAITISVIFKNLFIL